MDKRIEATLLYPKRSDPTPSGDYVAINVKELDDLEQQRDDLLEALIEDGLGFSRSLENEPALKSGLAYNVYLKRIKIIEKACYPLKWKEIKELKS